MAITVSGPVAELRELFAVSDPAVLARLNDIVLTLAVFGGKLESIIMTEAEFIAALDAQTTKLELQGATIAKVSAETTGLQDAIAALQAAVTPGSVSPAVEAALARVVASVDVLGAALTAHDNQVADVVPNP